MPVYSVSQVTSYLRGSLERDAVLQDLWIGGEVTSLSRSGTGHAYFTLRDDGAALRCVMFRNSRGSEHLDGGAAIVAHGRVSIYAVRGDLQIIVDIAQPEGVGELQLRLEQLKLKLERDGLFDPSRKRDLPAFPRRVAVVTSPTGAVWHDIQTVISRRYPLVELMLASAPVQGDRAAPGIVDALAAVNETPNVDLVIVARGGGSLEDLWPFNDEAVARAIYASRVPVISAIGHETDSTIADLVADRRAATPSAAAEMAVPDSVDLAGRVLVADRALQAAVSGSLSSRSRAVGQLVDRADRGRPDLDGLRVRIDDMLAAASAHLTHDLRIRAERLEGLRHRLESLSPDDTLRRGYAIVERGENGVVVTDPAQVDHGDELAVTVSRGGFGATVTSAASRDRGGRAAPDGKTAGDVSIRMDISK